MSYQLKNLNVASLDFSDIRTSLIKFFKEQPDLADIDFENNASAANMLINILATATAYNGIYAQFGYVNSFATTTTLMQSILGIAANSSVLIAPVQGGIGTFHALVAYILVVFGVPEADGKIFAAIIHGTQMLLILGVGLISWILMLKIPAWKKPFVS
jgi:hypothetical protein